MTPAESETAMASHRHLRLDSIRRAVRGAVCPVCYQRPPGSETLPNNVARSCEGQCPIFCHLPKLYRITVRNDTSAPGALDKAVRETICEGCTLAPTAGEFCSEFANRTCPLSRFSGVVVLLMETLREWQHRKA